MKDYNVKVHKIEFFNNAVVISWAANIGFGELTISDGYIDSETLGEEFIRQTLDAAKEYMLENWKIEDYS